LGEKKVVWTKRAWFEECVRVPEPDDSPERLKALLVGLDAWETKNVINTKQTGTDQTCFMISCLVGKPKQLITLLELGADPSIAETEGYTCWHGIGFQARPENAKALLRYIKANPQQVEKYPVLDPKHRHKDQFTAFQRALWKHTPDAIRVIKILLAHDAVEEQDIGHTLFDPKKKEALSPEQLAIVLEANKKFRGEL